jgi:hypothetical protein
MSDRQRARGCFQQSGNYAFPILSMGSKLMGKAPAAYNGSNGMGVINKKEEKCPIGNY